MVKKVAEQDGLLRQSNKSTAVGEWSSVFFKLFLLFVFVPLADLILLLLIARYTGVLFSVSLVILSALFGAYFARRSGITVMRQIREKISSRQMPTESLADGAIVLFAAGLLLTPGLITDAVGMTMLIPYTRRWYKHRLSAWFKKRFKITSFTSATGFHDEADVVDSYVVNPQKSDDKDDNKDAPRKVDPAKIELQIDD